MKVTEPYTIFRRQLASGKTVYYYQFRMEDGRRSSARSTGCTSISAARRYCQKLYNSGDFRRSSKVSFKNYTDSFFSTESRYYKWKQANKETLTHETLLAYDKFLRNQLIPYFSDMLVTEIRRADIKEWVIWAAERWSPKTVNSAQSVMNIILKQAVDDEVIEANPCAGISFRDVKKKSRELLTIHEIRMMYHCGRWWYDNRSLFLLSIITGMRVSEIVALQDTDIHDNYIDVQSSYSRQFGMGSTKTHTSRYVPIPSDFSCYLKQRKGFLFVNHEGPRVGHPLNISSIYQNITEIYSMCGIDYRARNLTVHTNRNFYNSYLESQNVPERGTRFPCTLSQ